MMNERTIAERMKTILTDPAKAAAGTIRKEFGKDIEQNAVHGSDAPETARVEVAYFFPAHNVYAR